MFPESFVTIPKVPSEIIQKLKIDQENIKIKIYNAKGQPFLFRNITENTNTSLEESSRENMDAIVPSRPMSSNSIETTETEFNSTLLDDGTHFSSHTVNAL